MNLAAEYERLCGQPSDIVGHLPRFVELVRDLNAGHVIELGTRSGVSTVAWLYGLEATGGRLTSIDIDPGPDLSHPAWTFIQGDDLDPQIVANLDQADIVFIDTTHHFEQTVAELGVYRYLVRPGGVICCHDTQLERPPGSSQLGPRFPVRRAIEQFADAEGFEWVEYPDSYGLGVITIS